MPGPIWLKDKIGGPREAHGVSTEAEYRARALGHSANMRRAGYPVPERLTEREERPDAYISCGRWVVDCDCGNGPSTSPELPVAICFDCLSVWYPRFPSDWQAAETALLERPDPDSRHWFPTLSLAARNGLEKAETVALLKAENELLRAGRES